MMTGNLQMTARMLKIPDENVRRWAKSTWWKEIVDDLKTERELVLSARLQKIVDKSLDVIEDRLEHGDYVYDQKTGTMRRKLVAMRDAHKVGLDLQTRQDLILNRQTPQASEEQIDAKLNKLAAKFAAIVNGQKEFNNDEAIDVDVKEPDNEDGNIYSEVKVVSDHGELPEVRDNDGQEEMGELCQEEQSGDIA